MFSNPSAAGGPTGLSLHNSLDLVHKQATQQGAAGRWGSLPRALHHALHSALAHQQITPPLNSTTSSKDMHQLQRNATTDVEMIADVGSGVGQHRAGWRQDWRDDVIDDLTAQGNTLRQRPASQHTDRTEQTYQAVALAAGMRQERGLSDSQIYSSAGALRGTQQLGIVRPVVAQGNPLSVRRPVSVSQFTEQPAARPGGGALPALPRPAQAENDKSALVNNAVARITSMAGGMTSDGSRGVEQQDQHRPSERPTYDTPSAVACSSNDSTTAYLEYRQEMAATDEEANCKDMTFSFSEAKMPLVYSQSYVYRPISYPDHASPNALAMANAIMTRLTIPGEVRYKPVLYGSKLFQQGTRFGFTAFATCLGSSYFQRLIGSMPHLEYAVRRGGPMFAEYVECMDVCSERRLALLHSQYGGQYRQSTPITEEATLASIQYACIYLATKMVDRMPMLEMLRYILTHLYGSVVSKAQAYDVESKCLEGLQFRLGPYFLADVLEDDWPY